MFGHDIKVSNYIDCAEQPKLRAKYFLGIHKSLTYLDIKNAINAQIWRDNDKDIVKFVALYLEFQDYQRQII